jgi:YHS domain-containing protein
VRVLLIVSILALLAVALWPVIERWLPRLRGLARVETRPDELVKDPVCQTYVVRSRAVRRDIEGHVFFFCSPTCAERYLRGRWSS